LLTRFKEDWRFLREGRSGERFERLYRHRQSSGKSKLRKLATVLAGILVIGAGIFFLPVAGPGTLIILAGAALLASESRLTARALDRGEVEARKIFAALVKFWERAPTHLRVGVAICALALLGSTAFAVYKLALSRQ
jgi:hypothetical protein